MAIDVVDGPPAKRWQNVFFEDSQDLRERALAALLQAKSAELHPLIEHGLEGTLCRKTNSTALLFSVLIRIDALGNQGARLVTSCARFFEADLRVTTQGHALLLARPVVTEKPDFSAAGRHIERETIAVTERVVITGDSGVPNCHF